MAKTISEMTVVHERTPQGYRKTSAYRLIKRLICGDHYCAARYALTRLVNSIKSLTEKSSGRLV